MPILAMCRKCGPIRLSLGGSPSFQLARSLLLQHPERNRERRPSRLSDKQMYMLRHQNISGNHKAVPQAHCLKLALQDAVRRRHAQQRLPAITTERHKVETAALLITDKFGHDGSILLPVRSSRFAVAHPSAKCAEGWGTLGCGNSRVRHPPFQAAVDGENNGRG